MQTEYGQHFRHIAGLVRPARPRSALETHPRSLPHLAFRSYPPADPRRAGHGLLPALHGALSRRRVAGRRSGGRGAQVVAGTRLLQPCAQPARRGAAGRGAVRRRVSPVLRRGPLAAGRRRLYRRGRLLGRLRRSLRRARRQCFPGAGAAFRYRPSDRLHGRKAHVRRTGADAGSTSAVRGVTIRPSWISGRCNALRRSPDAPTVRLRRAVWLWPQERLRSVPSSSRKPRCATVGSTTCTSHAATGPCCGGAGKATSGRGCTSFR